MQLLCFLLLILFSTSGVAQRVSLSFDDGLNPGVTAKASQWNQAILEALDQAGIQSILFAAGNNVDSPSGLELVKNWGEHGHFVGNHTYSHMNFSSDKVLLEAFIEDVEKNERLLEKMPNWELIFRFPYLKEGKTKQKRDAFRRWLKDQNYKAGPVSIDASDWYYNSRYLKWHKKNPDESPTAYLSAYLDHLWQRSIYYDSLSVAVLGRSIDHILLLHVNAINAQFLPDVIKMYRQKGWEVIDFKEAIDDSVYARQPETLPAGESIVWSFAKEKGDSNLRYPAEDSRYEKSILDNLGL